MIKKIHYCWFGNKPMSALDLKCIESWKKVLPDWEIVKWDETNIDVNSFPLFAKQTYEKKVYGFLADYLRAKILYEHGGFYLDTDVEIFKDPTSIIDNDFIACFEAKRYLGSAILYSNPKGKIIKELLDLYSSCSFDKQTMPRKMSKLLAKKKYFIRNGKYQKNKFLTVYPREYFFPYNPYFMLWQPGITKNTYFNHHFAGSWLKRDMLIIKLFKKINYKHFKKNKYIKVDK